MGITRLSLLLCLGPNLAFAQSYECAGSTPDWTLQINGDSATFSMAETQMSIPQQTTAKMRDWPKALTLIGGRDTAIVILNERVCSTEEITQYPIETHILTQRGETPVILTGCCTIP